MSINYLRYWRRRERERLLRAFGGEAGREETAGRRNVGVGAGGDGGGRVSHSWQKRCGGGGAESFQRKDASLRRNAAKKMYKCNRASYN
jgi:hypothetical protein